MTYYWISYQIYDRINGEALPPSDRVIKKHPFEWLKDSLLVKNALWTILNYKEITEQEYNLHPRKV